jgi:SLT domain-containing protein
MSVVVQLRQREHVSVDSILISTLFRKLGPAQAETVIVNGIEQLCAVLRGIDRDYGSKDITKIGTPLAEARSIAQQLGLVSLATVMGGLAEACRNRDTVAAHALWERVKRIGDRSVVDLWELPQLRM